MIEWCFAQVFYVLSESQLWVKPYPQVGDWGGKSDDLAIKDKLRYGQGENLMGSTNKECLSFAAIQLYSAAIPIVEQF